jgi:predicted small integral membrane protein
MYLMWYSARFEWQGWLSQQADGLPEGICSMTATLRLLLHINQVPLVE